MSIKTKIAALALATLAVTGSIASTTTRLKPSRSAGAGASEPASSAPPIVGSAIAASDGYYYDGYRRCGWVRQFDAFGNYMGRVRTCNF